jgi:hypothetical protein
MSNYKVLFDAKESGIIRVVGVGDYVPWPMWNEKLQECEALLISEMDQLCLTVGEVNEIRAEAGRAGFVAGYMWHVIEDSNDIEKQWAEQESELYAEKIRQGGDV